MVKRLSGQSRQERNRRILKACPVCHICGGSIDLTLKWPDPMSGVVDHIMAITRPGGTEDPSNLAPAHAQCNARKADKDFAPIIRRSGSLNRP